MDSPIFFQFGNTLGFFFIKKWFSEALLQWSHQYNIYLMFLGHFETWISYKILSYENIKYTPLTLKVTLYFNILFGRFELLMCVL